MSLSRRPNLCHLPLKQITTVYATLFEDSLSRILSGPLIHADETEITVLGREHCYVWTLTNMHDVVFLLRESRESTFLKDLLSQSSFSGVLLSDFFSGYESMPCKQQRCLVHLMRDFNQDIRQSPWDNELNNLATQFGELLRNIVSSIDEFGLKASKLRNHKSACDLFLNQLQATVYKSELAEAMRVRLLKNRDRLFTFLDYDNVPWNNNNAEHAMKYFARYREERGSHTFEALRCHLVFLSIYVTCRYRGLSFLRFLLSKKLSFEPSHCMNESDLFDLYPIDYKPPHRLSKQTAGEKRIVDSEC